MAAEAARAAESVAAVPADCPLCKAEFESNWMAQIHYRTLLEEGGPEDAYTAFNEDFAEDHAEHSDGKVGEE